VAAAGVAEDAESNNTFRRLLGSATVGTVPTTAGNSGRAVTIAMMMSPPTCSPSARDTPLANDEDDDKGITEET